VCEPGLGKRSAQCGTVMMRHGRIGDDQYPTVFYLWGN
jgi:hypothetical protein